MNRHFILFHRVSPLLLFSVLTITAYAQTTVTGTLTDAGDQTPLIGATILIKGTSGGTVTDFDGNYSVTVPGPDAVLVVSYTGYQGLEIPVEGRSQIDLTLSAGQSLEEIIVVGYGTKKKSDLVGAISSLSREDFEKQPVTRVSDALQGRTAGVQISNTNGSPGNNAKIRIRGTNSITGNSDPLIVVDGIINGASLGSLNPGDIENIQVLKDASATAIYGSRGANGVILVTTRRGEGEARINFASFFGFQSLPKKIDIVDPATYAGLVNEQLVTAGSPVAFSAADISALNNGGGTDWQDEIYRGGAEALNQNYTISASGEENGISFFVSGNVVQNEGILLNNHADRYAFRTNVNFDVNDRLNVGINATYSKEQSLNGFISDLLFAPNASALIFDPTADAFQEDGVTPTKFSPFGSIAVSPLASALGREDERNTTNTTGTLFLNYKLTDKLSYFFTGGIRDVGAVNTNFVREYATTGLNAVNINNNSFTQLQHTHQLQYQDDFGSHGLVLKGIFEEQSISNYGSSAQGQGLLVENVGIDNVSFANSQNIFSGQSREGIRSYMGRVEYDYDGKYLLTGTVRVDGSSKFKGDNRYSVFPSVAAAWRISEEDFLSSSTSISNLKLRASYGKIGNQAISPYSTFGLLQFGTAFAAVLDNTTAVTGVAPGRIADNDLKWETTTQTDLGVDLGLFEGRLNLSLDWYKKNTEDLLLFVSVPTFTGVSSVLRNVGEVENTGFEVELGAVVVNKGAFRYDAAFNLSSNQTTVLDIGNNDAIFPGGTLAGSNGIPSRIEVGGEIGNFLGYVNEGVYSTAEADLAGTFNRQPGDVKYKDVNEDGMINADDVTVIGNGAPDFVWGLNNTISYGNFELNVFFQSMVGHDIFNLQRAVMLGASGDVKTPLHADILNRWTPDNQDTDIPAFSNTNFQVPEDSRFIEDGTFIRLRNVRLGYTFNNIGGFLKNATVYASGQNLLTFTGYKGYDPEVSGSGNNNTLLSVDNGTYPNPKVVTVGFNTTF